MSSSLLYNQGLPLIGQLQLLVQLTGDTKSTQEKLKDLESPQRPTELLAILKCFGQTQVSGLLQSARESLSRLRNQNSLKMVEDHRE